MTLRISVHYNLLSSLFDGCHGLNASSREPWRQAFGQSQLNSEACQLPSRLKRVRCGYLYNKYSNTVGLSVCTPVTEKRTWLGVLGEGRQHFPVAQSKTSSGAEYYSFLTNGVET
jgi:hypothetical protein